MRIRSALAPLANSGPEDPQRLLRHDPQHQQHRDRGRQRPPGDVLVEAVQPRTLTSMVEVGDERAERQRHRREEQEQRLSGSQHGPVDPHPRGARRPAVAPQHRQHEEVGPEDQLREQRGGRAESAEPEERAGALLRDPFTDEVALGEPAALAVPSHHRDRQGERPRRPERERRGPGRLRPQPEQDRQDDPAHRLRDPLRVQRVPHDLQSARGSHVDERQRGEGHRHRGRPERGLGERRDRREALRQPPRREERHSRQRHRDGGRDRGRAPNEPSGSRDLAPAFEDRHQPHVRDVHPESRGGRGDEGGLCGEGDDAERLVAERVRVIRTCATNVATAPIPRPSTFWPVWPTITRWSELLTARSLRARRRRAREASSGPA